jgi:hypothetical protein
MNTLLNFKISLIAAGLLALSTAQAANMTRDDYSAAKSRISSQYKSDKSACNSLKSNAKDVCVEEAKAKEKVAKAELEFAHSGKPADENKVRVARAEAAYAVAKEKCDDLAGNAKDVCVKEAKATEKKALGSVKMGKEINEARSEAKEDAREADYKVAIEKCDAMAGDAKANCVASAKARFGKS